MYIFRSAIGNKFYIRDFLMACLLVMGGGNQDDLIQNMTVREWKARQTENAWDDEEVKTNTS